jgi:TolB-like protein/DNA-binding winged helix-turn-helix (wHTH) protein
MLESPPVKGTFRLGEWVVDPERDRIARGAETTYLRPQVMELLVYLARHPGRVISSEELLDRLWAGKVVTGGSVYNCVAELRRALTSGPDHPGLVETIPKKGYRLLAPVSGLDGVGQDRCRPRMAWMVTAVVAAAAVVVYLADAWLMDPVEPTRPDAADIDPRSIAVLPFSDVSAATEDTAFLSFGIHDDLVTLLSQVRDLKVISRDSVRRFASADEDVGEIGATLGVGSILVGSVRRASDQVRVNVRLIDAMSGRQIWSGQYDREISVANIFAMQSEIVERITAELQAALTPAERSSLSDVPTTNFAAYEAFQFDG